MFDSYIKDTLRHDDFFDWDFFDEKIALEMKYTLLPHKYVSRRTVQAPQVLDYIADIGGIYILFDILFYVLVVSYGGRLLLTYMTNSLFLVRRKYPG